MVNVGVGQDDTLGRLERLREQHPKISLFEHAWPLDDPNKKRGGQILAEETNLALARCRHDWCFYLQADELLHQEDYPIIRESFERACAQKAEGVVFTYRHFYGAYNVVQDSRSAYRREVRLVRRSAEACSVGDAQSFRKISGEKLTCILSPARIYHYGWVKSPEAMRQKTFFMDQLYHGDPTPENAAAGRPHSGLNYRYKRFWGLKPFGERPGETHPELMLPLIQRHPRWALELSPWVFSRGDLKRIVLDLWERLSGHRAFEYRSYRWLRNSQK